MSTYFIFYPLNNSFGINTNILDTNIINLANENYIGMLNTNLRI